jgi:hypothetical protein
MTNLATLELGTSTVVLRRAQADDIPAIVDLLSADQLGVTRDGVHTAQDLAAYHAAGAHQADLATQAPYGVNYLRYWVDEEAGKIFCLVDAPDAEAANTVHRQAHGLVADEIYPVSEHA